MSYSDECCGKSQMVNPANYTAQQAKLAKVGYIDSPTPKEPTILDRINNLEKVVQELFDRTNVLRERTDHAHARVDNVGASMGMLF